MNELQPMLNRVCEQCFSYIPNRMKSQLVWFANIIDIFFLHTALRPNAGRGSANPQSERTEQRGHTGEIRPSLQYERQNERRLLLFAIKSISSKGENWRRTGESRESSSWKSRTQWDGQMRQGPGLYRCDAVFVYIMCVYMYGADACALRSDGGRIGPHTNAVLCALFLIS